MQRVLDFLSYATTHKAAVTAAITLALMALASFGVVIPHVPHELVTAIGLILTGFFGVSTDEAAYIEGVIDGLDGALGESVGGAA
jgi:hypothetical protein